MEGLATSAERFYQIHAGKIHARSSRSRVFWCYFWRNQMGNFVEIIENKCEGMVRIRDIKMIIILSMKQYTLVGATSHQLLQLGDEIYVKVKNADLVKKLDFNFLRRVDEPIN
jgi:ribonuclease R